MDEMKVLLNEILAFKGFISKKSYYGPPCYETKALVLKSNTVDIVN